MLPASIGIDFRDSVWSGCNNQPSCSQFGGITVTQAPTDPGLFWAADDDFDVRGGELDEVNFPEILTVEFSTPVAVNGVWLTDIFTAPDGGADGEEVIVSLLLAGELVTSAAFMFFAEEPLGTNNGGIFGDFGGSFVVDMVVFESVNEPNDE